MAEQNIIVYDLETQKTFAEVENGKPELLRVSYLGLYSFSQNQYFGFFEPDLPKLEAIMLKEQPLLIGFNSIHFDNKVLQPYFKQLNISTLPQLDILAEIYNSLGFRMKLESVAQATLGTGKSGSGLDAIRYFRTGNLEALSKYCLDDVRITKDIYLYGKQHGFILYTAAGELARLPVSWGNAPTITDQLKQAWQQHQRCSISYLQMEPTRQIYNTEIDVITFNPKTITAYCQQAHATKPFSVDRIQTLSITKQQYAYQAVLF
ncbi:MAG: ribonuclease H-like domain-containing protein [Patescibacteria group bacterium]|jgi:DEAD/DEAH box helicase domain-containing protein